MNSSEEHPEPARPHEDRAKNADALGEAARRLPEVVKHVDRLQAAWNVLMSPRTPKWKRVVVALEVARLVFIKRFRKEPPTSEVSPVPAVDTERSGAQK